MSDDQYTRPIPEGNPPSASPSSLKGLTMALGIGPAESGQDALLGSDIGGVRIVRLIAEGGMGRVYEGKQEKPNRTVAVKVMRPGLTSPSILKRFEYEAEVLGRLQHSGIAHIYSVGVHQIGNATVPYFVMEYIADARTLTKYADELRLPTRQRLGLFRSVCEAVAHGHQKGVIHRDLKPSNILVDATGQPKVIDFGVARATDSDMALTTMQTDVGQLIGTLQYMSPEQFKADPNDIDVRSDVYALGVILYELLAGKMPYDVKKKAIHEVARIVQEDDPTPLSSFNRGLKGDVAVIAGKCLEKDRGRRYSSASEVGADVGRYLTGEPISASPPGFVDGLIRLAKKHRAAATAFCAVMATLVAAIVGVSYFALIASAARTQAVHERTRAEANAEEARAQAADARKQSEKAEAEAMRAVKALEMESRAKAEANEARRHLYAKTLLRVSELIDDNELRFAQTTFQSAIRLYESQDIHDDDGLSDTPTRDDTLANSPESRFNNSPNRNLDDLPIEARCLHSRLEDAILVLRSPKSSLTAMTFNPNGDKLATGSADGVVTIWDTTRGSVLLARDSHAERVTQVIYSEDGRQMLSASLDGTAKLWDTAAAGETVTLRAHTGGIRGAAISPDGRRVATASQDGTVMLWDAASGELIHRLEGHGQPVHTVNFSSDGKRLATAADHKIGRLWDVDTGKEIAVLAGHSGWLNSIVFNDDGTRLATVGGMNGTDWDGTMRIWDGLTGKELKRTERLYNSVRYSRDGRRLITTGEHGVIWDTAEMKSVLTLKGHSQVVGTAAFTTDGKRVATGAGDCTVRVWDTIAGSQSLVLRGHQDRVAKVAFSNDGRLLASMAKDGTVRLWDVGAGVASNTFPAKGGWLDCLAISSDGGRLVTGSWDKTARLWDTTTCAQLGALKGHSRDVDGVAFSSDGNRIATASADGTARIWDAITGVELLVLKGHKGGLDDITFSPDGKEVATASLDKTARIWNSVSGEQRVVLKKHALGLHSVAYSQDGRYLVTGAEDGIACIWEAATGICAMELKGHSGTIWSVMYSPDGTRIATASEDGTARIWEASTGAELLTLEGHAGCVRGVAFDPGGTRIVTGSLDNTCRVWDAETGEELAVMVSDARAVAAVQFSRDGRYVVSGWGDSARIWGGSNAERFAARLREEDTQQKLEPLIQQWCSEGAKKVGEEMRKAQQTMAPAEYREATKMTLRRLKGR